MLTNLRVLKTVAESNMEIALVTGRQMEEPRRTAFLQGAELRYVKAQALANAIIEDVALALETGTFATPIDVLGRKCDEMELKFRDFVIFLELESGPRQASYSDDLKLITGTFTFIRELLRWQRTPAEAASVAKQIRLLLWKRWPSGMNFGAGAGRTGSEPLA